MGNSIERLGNPAVFQATWNPSITHLKPSFSDKVKRIFFYFLQNLATKFILQTNNKSSKEVQFVEKRFNEFWYGNISHQQGNQVLRDTFSASSSRLTTPDGINLSSTYLKHKHAPQNAKTVILFQPNAALSKGSTFEWLFYKSIETGTPTHFILFDYRGGGTSKGKVWNSKQVILDGETVYQFAKDHLKVPEHLIDLYGYSFGGVVSAEVKDLHLQNTGRFVNERSFSSLEEEIKHLLPRFFSGFAAKLLKFVGWSLNASNALKNSLGQKLIVYHPEDPVVPYKASTAHFFQQKLSYKKEVEVIKLDKAVGYTGNHHCIPLVAYTGTPVSPAERVSDFIFSKTF